MTSDIEQNNSNAALVKPFAPSEVIGIFAQYLATKGNGRITVKGEYIKNGNRCYGGYYYDMLLDETTGQELSIKVPELFREKMENGKIIEIYGLIERKIQKNCSVQLQLCVSGINDIQEKEVSEEDLKRIEIRRKKNTVGYRKVDQILESIIFSDRRPSVALLYAESSITDSDFAQGKESAESAVDFKEYRVSFAKPAEFVSKLQEIDSNGHDIMCIVRGGGSGLESLDNLDVLDCVAGLRTPVISAVGHVEDKVFINEISDLEIGTPSLLGSWFQNHVESIAKKKADSTAALTKKIEGQFKQQLDTSKKQNEELQKKLEELTKTSSESQKLHDKQVQDAAAQHKTQMEELQKQLKSLTDTNGKQAKDFNEQLGKMQEGTNKLNETITKLTSENTASMKALSAEKEKNAELQNAVGQKKTTPLVYALGAVIVVLILLLILK